MRTKLFIRALAIGVAGLIAVSVGPVSWAQTDADIVQEGDNEGEAVQDGTAETGDAGAGSQITGVVAEPGSTTSVRKSNTSEDSEATSGDSTVASTASQDVGPRAEPDEAGCPPALTPGSIEGPVGACIVQDGDNSADTTQTTSAGSGDALAGTQVTGIVNGGDTVVVDLENIAEDAESTSGDADAFDDLFASVGPVTGEAVTLGEDVGDAAIEGPITADIVQDGDNDLTADQTAAAASGDAVVGSQVAGAVATGAGNIAITGTQSSDGDEGTTGDATSDNDSGTDGALHAGPVVGGKTVNLGPDDAAIEGPIIGSSVVQDGDNDLDLEQTAGATTGDTVVGGQVVGVVSAGDVDLTLDNTSEDNEGTSGDATAENDTGNVFAGDAFGGNVVNANSITTDGDLVGEIIHDGDNEVAAAQDAAAATGDAVSGAQIAGGVVGAGGSFAADATNAAEDDESTSGDATATNDVLNVIGGNLSGGKGINLNPAAGSIEAGGNIAASIVHDGDNENDFAQSADSATGDAVTGASIWGVVGAGDVSVVTDNSSEDDEATSGDADSANAAANALAGNLSGKGININPGPEEASIEAGGAIEADLVHEGDNELGFVQEAGSATGDAVGGAQIAGVVSEAGGSAALDLTNASEDSEAVTGDADSFNDSLNALASNIADDQNLNVNPGAASINADELAAFIAHDGDNELDFAQEAGSATGDAVAGGGVLGLVGGGDVDGVSSNTSDGAEATSGDATSDNDSANALAGNAAAANNIHFNPASIEVGTATVDIIHEGDNGLDFAQEAGSATGDAVAGGQVAGVVSTAGGSAALDLTSTAEDPEATSGDADSTNDSNNALSGNKFAGNNIEFEVVPESIEVGAVFAGIVQDGDNDLGLNQSAATASGDAVAGGQIAGVVGSGDTTLVLDSTSEDDEAVSGNATADNLSNNALSGNIFGDGDVVFGPGLESITIGTGTAGIVQDGDNDLEVGQDASAATGDAVGGGQVAGVVTGAGGVVSIDASSSSEDSEATSGEADSTNSVDEALAGNLLADSDVGDVGADSIDVGTLDAGIVHEGDNDLSIGQGAATASGDAVGGGQIMGAVVSDGSLDVTATNNAEDAEATSGDVTADNFVDFAFVGGFGADGDLVLAAIDGDIDAAIIHDGDNDGTIDQSLDAASGDAVAGGQVTGAVVTGGTAEVVQDNTSEDDQTTTGNVTGTKTLDNFLIGPILATDILVLEGTEA